MSLWLAPQPLVLASKSEARRTMLEAAGIALEIHPAAIDERALEKEADTTDPREAAQLLARAKASAVAASRPGRLVLGADQTLACDRKRFSKPRDRDGARAQLTSLRGRMHELHSAVALARDGHVLFEHADVARLTMRPFSDSFLEAYLEAAGAAVTASVGGYQLEGLGIQLFERVDGDHFTILGLPLLPLLHFLRCEKYLQA